MGNKRRLIRSINEAAVKRALAAQERRKSKVKGSRALGIVPAYILSYTPATIGNRKGGGDANENRD